MPGGATTANPYYAFIADVGAIAMGATTYEWILEHDRAPGPTATAGWVFTHHDLPVQEGAAILHDHPRVAGRSTRR